MKCTHCGQEYEGTSCPNCGEQPSVPENSGGEAVVSPADNKKDLMAVLKNLPKTVWIACGAVLVVVLLLAILISALKPNMFVPGEHQFLFYYDSEEDKTTIIMDTKVLSAKMDGYVTTKAYSEDGSVYLVMDSENTLYSVTKSGPRKVADDVEECYLSYTGKGGVYLSDGNLVLFTVGKDETVKVDSDISVSSLAISPDGKTLLYSAYNDDGETELYRYQDKKEKLGNNMRAVAIADGGKYVYALSNENDLCFFNKKGEKTKIGDQCTGNVIVFNNDLSEIIFDRDGKLFFSSKGSDRISIGKLTGSFYAIQTYGGYSFDSVSILSFDHLMDHTYMLNGNAVFLKKKGSEIESVKLAGECSARITEDGETLVYTKNNNLYKTSARKEQETVKLADDVEAFVISPDGKYIYFINEDDELYGMKGNGDPKRIASDLSDWTMSAEGVLFFITDETDDLGTLCYCKNGKTKKKLDDSVSFVIAYDTVVYYRKATSADDGTYDIYASKGGTSFSAILKNLD